MRFMLIVKNLFSFCVELEILLHFLLDFRLWSVNEDINMRNEAWGEMDRTYTKKSSEKYFLERITDRNTRTVDPVKKWPELQTTINGAKSANSRFESGFS
jgi:hypothetical protein